MDLQKRIEKMRNTARKNPQQTSLDNDVFDRGIALEVLSNERMYEEAVAEIGRARLIKALQYFGANKLAAKVAKFKKSMRQHAKSAPSQSHLS